MNLYEFKSLQVNFFERSVKINGEDVQIVAKMYDLFEYLIRNKEIILSKNTLFNRVWGFESETTFSVVEVYISKLRKLLEKGELAGQLLTIKNAGYCWTEKDTSALQTFKFIKIHSKILVITPQNRLDYGKQLFISEIAG